eukprot:GHRQ01026697.1.p2 GENE.GHRQ01026697.1~~GHRQ01026697.1.p2  ORF type:complete len:121 (+),score=38.00 GHRQ01026697.1:405-767(+)
MLGSTIVQAAHRHATQTQEQQRSQLQHTYSDTIAAAAGGTAAATQHAKVYFCHRAAHSPRASAAAAPGHSGSPRPGQTRSAALTPQHQGQKCCPQTHHAALPPLLLSSSAAGPAVAAPAA